MGIYRISIGESKAAPARAPARLTQDRADGELRHICPGGTGSGTHGGTPRHTSAGSVTKTASCAEWLVYGPCVMPDTDSEPESAAGGRLPLTGAKWATAAQVVAVAAGVLAMASGLLMWRIVGYTAANLATGVSFEPNSITNGSDLLSVTPAGAGALVAVAALALRGRARWLRYLQIGLWLLALASSVYIVNTCAPFTGLGPLSGPLAIGDISGVVAIVLLTLSLRRPASRQPRWHLAFVLLAVALPCIAAGRGATYPAYGPGFGIMTGIVAKCSLAEDKAAGGDPDPSRVVTVSVQNQAGQTVASQRLPFRTSGARYRMRLPRGTYSLNAVPGSDDSSAGDTVYVPADMTNEEDFDDASLACVG